VPERFRVDRLPLTYDECRARFRHAAQDADRDWLALPLECAGPHGEQLTIDVVTLGRADAPNVLIVLSGVHGVEGFLGSTLQTDLLSRSPAIPDSVRVVLVHAVNPWGMAWGRRQNESNVDLNRNWHRDTAVPFANEAYEVLHPVVCPDSDDLPSLTVLDDEIGRLVATRGLAWVRDGITLGQYTHPDGLHFGGDRVEQSNSLLEAAVGEAAARAERVLVVDLHTGHGRRGAITALSDQPPDSAQDRFLRTWCDRVEPTVDNPSATTGCKIGQIGNGLRALLAPAACHSTSLEFGTVDDVTQLHATCHEQWVHRRGDSANVRHRRARWTYRTCFTPDDAQWEREALAGGRAHLDRALAAVAGWR
jgi:predicted deacylase